MQVRLNMTMKYLFIFFILFFDITVQSADAQGIYISQLKKETNYISKPIQFMPLFSAQMRNSKSILQKPVPENYYTRDFGFFCRRELKMEKMGTSVHFRLGNMDNCNTLEGKACYRNAIEESK